MHDFVKNAFREKFGNDPAAVIRSPGRIALLGAHTDYNDGWVMPCAIDRAIWLAVAPQDANQIDLYSTNLKRDGSFALDNLHPDNRVFEHEKTWVNYPAGVAWALQQDGAPLVGMKGVLASDLPMGAGVSSSAAVEMAFMLAWEALTHHKIDPMRKAQLGQLTENEYVGVSSGIMDQFACLFGQENKLVTLDCRTFEHDVVPFSADTVVLIADSGVRRELANSEFNVRQQQCVMGKRIFGRYLPNVRALRDVSIDDYHRYAHKLPADVRRRARHIIEECARVHAGKMALENGDLVEFGRIVTDTHIGMRDLYEISIPELDTLACSATYADGCYGATMMGGGFGGCVAAVVERDAIENVKATMEDAFVKDHNYIPPIYPVQIAAGAGIVEHHQRVL